MKGINILISLTLIAGLGYSQCTGGLFALPQALAASTAVFDEELLMSLAPMECADAMETPANNDLQASQKKGCADGNSCLEQAQRSAIRFVATVHDSGTHSNEIVPALLALMPNVEGQGRNTVLARAGPLYARSIIAARATVKRE